MPTLLAACVRLAPSKIEASASKRRDCAKQKPRQASRRKSSAERSRRVILTTIGSLQASQRINDLRESRRRGLGNPYRRVCSFGAGISRWQRRNNDEHRLDTMDHHPPFAQNPLNNTDAFFAFVAILSFTGL